MKIELIEYIAKALQAMQASGLIPEGIELPQPHIERTRDAKFGDFACNIAMLLTKILKRPPRDIAAQIIEHSASVDWIKKIEIAGPGFINFHLADTAQQSIVSAILTQGDAFGKSDLGQQKKVYMEYVSANPTGPLHVGHGRGAAYGATLANMLEAVGYRVHREYYVNDAGRQMHILATSTWLRYLAQCGDTIIFPKNGYQGDYVNDISATVKEQHAEQFVHAADTVFSDLPADEGEPDGDKEAHIDALIVRAKHLLGEENYTLFFDAAKNTITAGIKEDLAAFGVTYNEWFSENSLFTSGELDSGLEKLKKQGLTYEKNGALWFKSMEFGDDKDRVLVRDNGQTTYFASDVAYHHHKYQQGADKVIDILGADHHGYVIRLNAIVKALGHDTDSLSIPLIQFAILYRGKEKVSMSTRSGSFITLRELIDEVGCDAARFFYVMRKHEQHMDFDLELAKKHANENPVFYIQYAHARICSVMRQLEEKGMSYDQAAGLNALDALTESTEKALMTMLARYPETLTNAANTLEPHLLAHYLRDLAQAFHAFYNAHQLLVDDEKCRTARVTLSLATRQVLANGLKLLGVSCPEVM